MKIKEKVLKVEEEMKAREVKIFNEKEYKNHLRHLKRLINKRYKISIGKTIGEVFENMGVFILVLFLIPFLTLIKIFKIIFGRKK